LKCCRNINEDITHSACSAAWRWVAAPTAAVAGSVPTPEARLGRRYRAAPWPGLRPLYNHHFFACDVDRLGRQPTVAAPAPLSCSGMRWRWRGCISLPCLGSRSGGGGERTAWKGRKRGWENISCPYTHCRNLSDPLSQSQNYEPQEKSCPGGTARSPLHA